MICRLIILLLIAGCEESSIESSVNPLVEGKSIFSLADGSKNQKKISNATFPRGKFDILPLWV